MMSRWRAFTRRKTWMTDDFLVRAPQSQHWRPLVFSVTLLLAGLGTLIVFQVAPADSPLRLPSGMLSGGMIAMAGMSVTRRMQAYKHGWLMGRSAMIGSLIEAGKRGLSMEDWLRSQAETDAVMMGLHPDAFTKPREEDR